MATSDRPDFPKIENIRKTAPIQFEEAGAGVLQQCSPLPCHRPGGGLVRVLGDGRPVRNVPPVHFLAWIERGAFQRVREEADEARTGPVR
ncbi:hypothetical protein [Roseibium sp. Sym1]|uniref:hypothetical protein n=1 Tax=Roseibium sp. Sym1 TaxID=3016006 RepID=UPI0022B43AFB|nr:hypothetical protein [Roseibium sp. Sym1]